MELNVDKMEINEKNLFNMEQRVDFLSFSKALLEDGCVNSFREAIPQKKHFSTLYQWKNLFKWKECAMSCVWND